MITHNNNLMSNVMILDLTESVKSDEMIVVRL